MNKYFLSIIFLFAFLSINAHTLSGTVIDNDSGEVLIGANIYSAQSGIGTITNQYGYFSITIPKDSLSFVVSYIGYKSRTIFFNNDQDEIVNIKLETKSNLQEIIVKASKNKSRGTSFIIPIQTLEQMPAIGGETDILKSLSLFPGISTGQEGSSNLYIRGGTPDQNLFLLDGIPVYNVTHLGGYFSVFNSQAINSLQVHKGPFPAKFGGRLSSVLDINLKEGNKEQFKGNFGLGLLTSSLSLEGPIKKSKSSYILTSRVSYLGLINLFKNKSKSTSYFDYWLYDINGKVNFNLKKGKLFFSFYTGNDYGISYYNDATSSSGGKVLAFTSSESNTIWGNTTFSTRYVTPITKKLFGKFLFGYTQYKYKFSDNAVKQEYIAGDTIITKNSFTNASSVKDYIIQANFDLSASTFHYLKFGLGITFHGFTTDVNNSSIQFEEENVIESNEFFAYIDDDIKISRKLTANLGLRISGLMLNSKTYINPEPRLALYYNPTDVIKIFTSYSLNQQYIHLLQNNSFGLSNDIWVPATNIALPESAHQFTLGTNFSFKHFNLSIDGYFKKMNNLISYKKDVPNLFIDLKKWESLIETNGKGEAYGVEWLLRKSQGKWNGFFAYSLSWNYRQFDNLNNGKKYAFTYDRRHDISIVLNYKLTKKWKISSNWIFQTGTALTLPVGIISTPVGDTRSLIFGEKNNGRLPNYHRLDVGLEYEKISRRGNKVTWKFSFYNIYNRKNPSYLHIRPNVVLDNNDKFLYAIPETKQISLFSIIPALSYKYSF